MALGNFLVDHTRMASALCAAFCVMGIGPLQVSAVHLPSPGVDQTVQYILDVVNTESGAARSLQSQDTTWAYSISLAGPCAFNLTEERQDTRLNNPAGGASVSPIRQITHYLIPVRDMEFGEFSTHHTLEREGYMRVIIFTRRATIRRWHGDSTTAPADAEVVYDAAINFGKPNVDIFDIPLRLENALEHLTCLCRLVAAPDTAPVRPVFCSP